MVFSFASVTKISPFWMLPSRFKEPFVVEFQTFKIIDFSDLTEEVFISLIFSCVKTKVYYSPRNQAWLASKLPKNLLSARL